MQAAIVALERRAPRTKRGLGAHHAHNILGARGRRGRGAAERGSACNESREGEAANEHRQEAFVGFAETIERPSPLTIKSELFGH